MIHSHHCLIELLEFSADPQEIAEFQTPPGPQGLDRGKSHPTRGAAGRASFDPRGNQWLTVLLHHVPIKAA